MSEGDGEGVRVGFVEKGGSLIDFCRCASEVNGTEGCTFVGGP